MKKSDLDRRLDGYSRSAIALRAVRRGLSSRGIRYSAAAAAGAALAGAGTAEAALISSPNTGFSLSTFSGFNTAGLDVDGDGNDDLGVFVGGSFSVFSSGFSSSSSSFPFTSPGFGSAYNYGGIFGRVAPARGSSSNFSALGFSSMSLSTGRSTSLTFPAYNTPGPTFTSTLSRFAAFSFTAGSNTSGPPNLGWLKAVFQFGAGSTRVTFPTIVYNNTPGGPIHVGDVPSAVPEPSSVALMGLGLLALGGRGLREMRRRKKKGQISA